jgi:hypothetical protein
MYLIARFRAGDFERWKQVFDELRISASSMGVAGTAS